MKKIIILILFLFSICPVLVHGYDLDNGVLMIFKDYTVTKDTTIDEISKKFGQPKLTTISAFGGNAYSFYDDDYSYYLFFETDENGVIRSYGAIGGDFKMSWYEEGDTVNSIYSYMTGTAIDDYQKGHTYGAIQYNVNEKIMDKYWETYLADAKYLYNLQGHGLAALKVTNVVCGNNVKITQEVISEDLFYTNEQLKKNNSNFYLYAESNNKEQYIRLIRSGIDYFLGYAYAPNPIMFASSTENYSASESHKYLFFDVKVNDIDNQDSVTTFTFIDPNFLRERKKIALTEDEQQKLQKVLEQYNGYMDIINAHNGRFDTLFVVEPSYSELPLVAGQYTDDALQLATHYINMARVGIGIRPLKINKDIADAAQHKAALVVYNNIHNLASGHFPVKPEGLSDEFYNKAMEYMNENLFYGDLTSNISHSLNDAMGDPISCGHRYNLLDPYYTDWGTGIANSQGCHKFSGSEVDDTELVAWPSNGIFVSDIAYGGIGSWTANFYKNYKPTDETTVTVENLSSNETYEISQEKIHIIGRKVSFYDANIVYEPGDVFKITLHNVKNEKTNLTEDYSYRSVFYQLFGEDKVPVKDIDIDSDTIILKVGQTKQITALASPDDASSKIMSFTSNNQKVATVRQDGLVTGMKIGVTTIIIKCGDIEKKVTVRVEGDDAESYWLGDMDQDGLIELADAVTVIKIINGEIEQTDDLLLIGDMDGNGVLDMNDATAIIQLWMKLNFKVSSSEQSSSSISNSPIIIHDNLITSKSSKVNTDDIFMTIENNIQKWILHTDISNINQDQSINEARASFPVFGLVLGGY